MSYKASPSPQEVQLTEHADLEAEPAEPCEPAPMPLALSIAETKPLCQEAAVSPSRSVQVEPREPQRTDVESDQESHVTSTSACRASPVSPLSLCPPSISPCPVVKEPQRDTACLPRHDQTRVFIDHDTPTETKTQETYIRKVPSEDGPPDFSHEARPLEPAEYNQARTDEESGVSCSASEDLMAIVQSSSPSSPGLDLTDLGNRYPGTCIWSLELLIAAALCATRDAQMAAPEVASGPTAPPQHGMEILSELAELERLQQERRTQSGGMKSFSYLCLSCLLSYQYTSSKTVPESLCF